MKKDISFYWKLVIKPGLVIRLKNLHKTRNEVKEQNWGLRFSFAIRDSQWLKKTGFNPGRWAIGFPAMYALYRVINEMRPRSILEFGLGESSKFTCQYKKAFEETELTIIEQDADWLSVFDQHIFPVKENVRLLPIEKEKRLGKICYAYENLIPTIEGRKYDLIIIDGPWGSKQFSRSQILDIIERDLLEKDFVILMDDICRYGERQTLELIFLLLKQKGIIYYKGIYKGEKETCVICSEKYRFLSSI